MIRTAIVAGLAGLPLITAAPALADNGPVSSVSCSSPCNVVENTIAGYAAFPGDTVTNYGFLPGDTIENYTGPCSADGNELACTGPNYAALPGTTLQNWANLPGETIKNYANLPADTAAGYAAAAAQTAEAYGPG